MTVKTADATMMKTMPVTTAEVAAGVLDPRPCEGDLRNHVVPIL
jgi:hypothetical protein